MDPFENVIANPNSLRARELLRDHWLAIGNPQGKLIEAELALRGHGTYTFKEREHLGALSARLVAKHGREWAGRIAAWSPSLGGRNYDLGLLSFVNITGDDMLKHGEEIFRSAPILNLGIRAPLRLAQVLQMPQLKQLRSLFIQGESAFLDQEVKLLAACPSLANLIAGGAELQLISGDGLRTLQNSPYLRNLIAFNVTLPDGYQPLPGPLSFVQHEGRWWLQNSELAAPYWQAAADAASLACSSQTYTEEYKVHWPPNLDALIWTE